MKIFVNRTYGKIYFMIKTHYAFSTITTPIIMTIIFDAKLLPLMYATNACKKDNKIIFHSNKKYKVENVFVSY